MSAFIKLKPEDLVSVTYKTHPSQTSVLLTADPSSDSFISKQYRIETDDNFAPGQERNLIGVGGAAPRTGSYNLSGTIILLVDSDITSGEKRSLERLRSIYSDNSFVRPKNYTSSSIFSSSLQPVDRYMTVLNIPSVLYGSEIRPGSFKLEVDTSNDGITLTDDGFGGVLSSSVVIGSIFYQHGIVMLGHNSLPFEGDYVTSPSYLHFSGTNTIPMTMYICTAPRGALNFSQNDSFTVYNTASSKHEITTKENKTFITTVGLYDKDYELLAIAKVAKPILNEEDGSVQFRLRLNY